MAGQTGADVERVEAIKQRCPSLFVEMDPGWLLTIITRPQLNVASDIPIWILPNLHTPY